MGVTAFSGPVAVGDLISGQTNGPNQGYVECFQSTNITQNSTTAVTSILYVPAGSIIRSFTVDVLTAYNSGTSATLSIGTSAGNGAYVSGVDCKTATGRIAITYTAAQLAAMSGQSVLGVAAAVAGPIYVTITVVGATSAGYVNVGMQYVPSQSNT